VSIGSTCQVAIYIEGSAREGTAANVADPTNVMGRARYRECGREGYSKLNGRWLCEQHYEETKKFDKWLDKQENRG